MKTKSYVALLGLVSFIGTNAEAQGTIVFQNFDFELAQLPVVPNGSSGGVVSSLDALPVWGVLPGLGGEVWHNTTTIGSPSIVVFGPNWNQASIFQGLYTVQLNTGFGDTLNNRSAIAQNGLIPAGSKSMQFYGAIFNMIVTFEGASLPIHEIGQGQNYTIYGVDVSQFAGTTGELRFTALPFVGGGFGGGLLDNIQFSNQTIPEPSTLGLFSLGTLLFGYRSRLVTKP